MSIGAALFKVQHRFEEAGIPDAGFEAELLLRHALYVSDLGRAPTLGAPAAPLVPRAYVFAHRGDPLPDDAAAAYDAMVERRIKREPAAYIIGHREFYGLDLFVTPDTLIPRPETELLVETVIGCVRSIASPAIVDIGTGSGAIAIALATTLPAATIWATDVSTAALDVARANARRHGVERRIAFRRGDLLEPLPTRVHVLAANLPYVSTAERPTLQPEVRDFEPPEALFADGEGLSVIARLLRQAPRYLNPGGVIVLEYGFGQTEALLSLACELIPDGRLDVLKDLAGIDRVLKIETSWSV